MEIKTDEEPLHEETAPFPWEKDPRNKRFIQEITRNSQESTLRGVAIHDIGGLKSKFQLAQELLAPETTHPEEHAILKSACLLFNKLEEFLKNERPFSPEELLTELEKHLSLINRNNHKPNAITEGKKPKEEKALDRLVFLAQSPFLESLIWSAAFLDRLSRGESSRQYCWEKLQTTSASLKDVASFVSPQLAEQVDPSLYFSGPMAIAAFNLFKNAWGHRLPGTEIKIAYSQDPEEGKRKLTITNECSSPLPEEVKTNPGLPFRSYDRVHYGLAIAAFNARALEGDLVIEQEEGEKHYLITFSLIWPYRHSRH